MDFLKRKKRKGVINELQFAAMGIIVLAVILAVGIVILNHVATASYGFEYGTVANESITGIQNASTNTTANGLILSLTGITNPTGNTTLTTSNYSVVAPNFINWTQLSVGPFGKTAYVSYTYGLNNGVNQTVATSVGALASIPNWLGTIIVVIVGAGLIGLIAFLFARRGGEGGLG